MEGGRRAGKRLGLLGRIREHEDAVEADFARFYPSVDYLDRYRRDSRGRTRLSLRRLLLLVDHLPQESAFASALAERHPISGEQAATYAVWSALTGKQHPYLDDLKNRRDQERKAQLIRSRRAATAEQNRRYMARVAGNRSS
ncbi:MULTISPECIES: hypothetical protein [unclassified Dietzia]|uniref:hypothetical protein n=1 Tax=unclassified Dietzia TaxID=2617939 RepID=UPI0015F7D048|nr:MULTISPECIES: hypothetical protein [unclassified Dietzia]MBB1022967.1 hypothetical protein [Dietzia sp. DQ12-76]MBB1026473.1 hypothetical protein [Dietzia sp. DQ11-38-2]